MSDKINNYNILVLGPSGSGKTVFLASMYKKLSTQSQESSFFVEASANQRARLVEKYAELASSTGWPPSTRYDEVSEWRFTCSVRASNGSSYPALQFTYLDYAGGRITDVQDNDVEADKFEKRLTEAHALLGILDGQKILALMQGGPAADRFAYFELPNILNIMAKSKNPIHFVITKWDIIEGQYSLASIRERLFKIDEFKNLVYTRIQDCRVRLIPISSVGTGFASLQKDGSMKKNPQMKPTPQRVEIPLCCVLPDIFTAEISKHSPLPQSGTISKPRLTFWETIGIITGSALRAVRGFLQGAYGLDELIIGKLIRYVETSSRNKHEEYTQEQKRLFAQREDSLKVVQDQNTAMQHAVDSFLYIITKLDLEFPDSDLSRMR